MTDMHNFSNTKNRAINELREMNKRATQPEDFCKPSAKKSKQIPHKTPLANFDMFFSNDEILIVSLILILSKDCTDYCLFLALLYILL